MKRILRLCLVIALLAPVGVLAANKEKKAKPIVKVKAVSVADNTVTILETDGTEKIYTVDSFTVISVHGKPGKLAEVQAGMKADVVASGKKIGRLDVMDPPPEKPEKKKKK